MVGTSRERTGRTVHLGNNPELTDPLNPGRASKEGTQNLTSLDDRFNTSRYLAPTSDIVALMTLEHQTRMTNLMTRIGWDARIALREGKGTLDPAARERINTEIEEMIGYMLFVDEEPLKEPVQGRLDVHQDVRRARASGCQGPVSAGFRSAKAPVPVSPVLHDLQRGVRWDAGRGAGSGLPGGCTTS